MVFTVSACKMDKMFMGCILMTFVGIASMTTFQDALNGIDNECLHGGQPAQTPCNKEKSDVVNLFQGNDLTGACTKLPAYKTCLNSACDPDTDLSDFIVTMEEKCAIDDFLHVLSIIDTQCTRSSNTVTDPCKTVKDAVDAQLQGDSLTDACKELPDYKMCLLNDCDQTADLKNSIRMMENTCGMNPSVTDILGVLGKIDDECKNGANLVLTPCSLEKDLVKTPLSGNSLTEACKKLSAYKTCLGQKCDTSDHLDEFISKMDDSCSSGFMKISVSVLALFLAAIVNFL